MDAAINCEDTLHNITSSDVNINQVVNNVLPEQYISTICEKIITDLCNYLTEYSDIDYMRDDIINKRARVLMTTKYEDKFKYIILSFIDFLTTDKKILEYINTNGKLIYNIHHYDTLDKKIYNYIYDTMLDPNDIAQGWMHWDYYEERFYINDKINLQIKQYMTNILIKYVFQQYDNKYIYADTIVDVAEKDIQHTENNQTTYTDDTKDTKDNTKDDTKDDTKEDGIDINDIDGIDINTELDSNLDSENDNDPEEDTKNDDDDDEDGDGDENEDKESMQNIMPGFLQGMNKDECVIS